MFKSISDRELVFDIQAESNAFELLIKLIDSIMYMVQDERASLIFNLMDHEAKTLDFERHGISSSPSLHTMTSVSSMLEEKNVVQDAMRVDATILTAGSFVKDGCKNSGELTGRTASIVSAYFNLIKFSTTPRPFVLTQMGRTVSELCSFKKKRYLHIHICYSTYTHYARMHVKLSKYNIKTMYLNA